MDPLASITNQLRPLGNGTVIFQEDYAPGIALIELSQPERHNAFSGKMIAEFRDIVLKLEATCRNSSLVAVILTGSRGRAFCSGIDLVFTREHLRDPELSIGVSRLMHDTLNRFAQLPLISCAAVAGPALGAGTELLTAFDYVCMSSLTYVQFVQTRMGVTSPWGGARRLVDRVGRKRALTILASAPRMDANYGQVTGLVDVVVNPRGQEHGYDSCLNAAKQLLAPFITDPFTQDRVSPDAVRGMKAIVAKTDLASDIEFEMALLKTVAPYSKL
ncbi:ClpP/crotonase [Hesseltinella vesiculosa]|uniref:ClpP/crotonase n=1 Tax=Hesseltinella vesiculosa TaxID=101127 RepID=A0A1X2GA21_9FUNG|nr:ClpP/crotonase [Hesseltinella vesiculosa]